MKAFIAPCLLLGLFSINPQSVKENPRGEQNSLFVEPFRVKAGDQYIDVDIGHAAPLFVDFDGDGLEDLLVGQFGEGKLRIYKNHGTKGNPIFKDFEWFKAGGELGTVPSG